jgi:hypothetical protein
MVSDMAAVRVYPMTDDTTVQDNPTAHRFELRIGNAVAFLQYRKPASGPIVLVHTEVPVALEGRGLGGKLVKAVMEAARSEGRQVEPRCPFARSYLERHPEYASLVVPVSS